MQNQSYVPMGTITFSFLMYLQSPYYNSSFWDLFRQLYDREKKVNHENEDSLKIRTATAIILMKKHELGGKKTKKTMLPLYGYARI